MASTQSPKPPDKNQGPAILGVSWSTLGLAIIVVVLRVIARVRASAFGFDDASIIVATLVSISGGVFNILQVRSGFGRHAVYLSDYQLESIQRWSVGAEMQAAISIGITKVSICWFVLRMLRKTNKWMRIIIWTDMACISAITIVYTFFQAFACIPLKAYWDPSVHGDCLSKLVLDRIALTVNIIDVITDFVCAAIPLAAVRRLQLNGHTKIMLSILISFGFITAATSIGKAVEVKFNLQDPSWDFVQESIWVILEENVAIIASSLPALRTLFKIVEKQFQLRKTSTQASDNKIWTGNANSVLTSDATRNFSGRKMDSDASSDELELFGHDGIVRQVDVDVMVTSEASRSQSESQSRRNDEHVDKF